jgi:prepilin-type N-terminal cleavage/methylation domain-containing protein
MQRTDVIRRRGGFTLIELMIVIGIIALLAGLLLVAIDKARRVGPRVQTKAEIGELNTAAESFKSTYNVQYLPTALLFTSNWQQLPPGASPILDDSRNYLSKVWPKANWAGWPGGNASLDGNQVLVLLLGGMPPSRMGWTNSPTNPFQVPVDGSVAKGPFFDFKSERIDQFGHYLDPYGQPYYYFSSRSGNDYEYFGRIYYRTAPDGTPNPDPAFGLPGIINGGFAGITREGGYGDPASQTQVAPIRGLDFKYLNPNGFQIISMGENKLPGRGSSCQEWNPNNVPWPQRQCVNAAMQPRWVQFEPGIGDYAPAGPGGDDLANFHRGPLGGE